MNTSLDWIKQALLDYAKTLPLSAQQPTLACADFHVSAVERDLAQLVEVRRKFEALQAEMESIGAPAPVGA